MLRECPNCGYQQDSFKEIFACEGCGMELDFTPYISEEFLKKEGGVGKLAEWSKENSKFIKIADGESYEGEYQGYSIGTNMNGDPAIIYKLDGKELKSSSAKLASMFDKLDIGTRVKISRSGEGLQTKWKLETI